LLKLHQADKIFNGFSFVNEDNMPRVAKTEVSSEAGAVGKIRRKNSFDDLELDLTNEVTGGDQSGSQAQDGESSTASKKGKRPKPMFESQLETAPINNNLASN
jgi:hypothetical protein